MSSRVLFDWGKLDAGIAAHPAVSVPFLLMPEIVERLREWREQLEESDSLDEIELRADLVLIDLCQMFGMTEEDVAQVMGTPYTGPTAAKL